MRRLLLSSVFVFFLSSTVIVSQESADTNGTDSLRIAADSLRSLANVQLEAGSCAAAVVSFEKEAELRRQLADSLGWCIALNESAEACLRADNLQHVIAVAHRALALGSLVFGETDTLVAKSYSILGIAYDRMGEYSLALDNLSKALSIRIELLGEDHLEVAASYNSLGIVHSNLGLYSEALENHNKALAIWIRLLGDRHTYVASGYSSIGNAYRNLGSYESALSSYERALAIQLELLGAKHPDVASTYDNLGIVYLDLGRYDEALLNHDRSLTIRLEALGAEHPDVAASYANIGEVYRSLGSYQLALSNHEKAIEIFTRTLGSNHPYLAGAYNNLAIVYGELGEYQKALQNYSRALDIQLAALGSTHPAVAFSYANIGNVYDELGDYDEALENLDQAYNILSKVLGAEHPVVASVQDNLANVFFNLGRYEEALANYGEVMVIRTGALGAEHPDVAVSYHNIGKVYQERGDFDLALDNNLRALAILKKSHGENHPDVAISYAKIGTINEELGQYDQALLNYRRALAIRLEILGPNHPRTGELFFHIGYAHRYRGDYDSALVYFTKSIEVFEGSRSKIESEQLRATYTETVSEQYEAIIGLLMDLNRPEEAFSYLERSKSKALQDALAERYEVEFGRGELRDKLQESRDLARQLETLHAQLVEEQVKPDSVRNETKVESLSELLAQTKAEYFQIASEIQADPDYAFAVKVDPVQIGTVRQDIPPGQKLLMCYAGERQLYLFLVSSEGYEVRSVPVSRNTIDSLVSRCRELCGVRYVNQLNMEGRLMGWSWDNDGSEFYQNEVRPLKEVLSRLNTYLISPFSTELAEARVVTIIPSGNLYYVPWGALLEECNDSLLFLSTRYNWHVMTSAELLKCIQRRETGALPAQPGSLVLVGNPEGTNLPSSEEEVAAISSVYPNSLTLTGSQATEAQVITAAPASEVLHLATHCRLDAQDPWQSYIQLASSAESDGRWSVAEISGQSWSSMQLVALSGCESALGGSRPGLEFESVAKAFSLAMEGPPSIVATLWPVEDVSTKQLMVSFYSQLKNHRKSEALMLAQSELIESDKFAHPFFWAPFILIGEWR